uniref:HMG box domain-containing protein n=1 Tax=Panagrolaimus superbus TaxID=310955 RepID=A0A914XZ90_9BILA
MKSANAKRRSNATVREKEAATMRAKRLNDDYREEENAKHVEYIRNLPEEADDERRLLAKKSNSLGNLRRKNKDVKGKVTAWNWFRQMVGPEIRKDLQTSNPEMNGQEFSRMWGAKVGEKWRSLSKDERKPFKGSCSSR